MIYVYAIVDAPRPDVTAVRGLANESLSVYSCMDLAAVVSAGHGSQPEPSSENALRHEQVVEALMRRHTVLPARFGTLFREPSDLQATLEKFHNRLMRGLERVRGRVELGLRVLWQPRQGHAPPAASTSESSGRNYMMARLVQEQRRREERHDAEQMADQLHAPLASLAADSSRRVLVAPELLLSAAYLVDRERGEEFRSAVERLAADHAALRLLCTGPWPPYHFVPSITSIDAGEGDA